ncbi:MAG: CPBP family intramembrane glutamic endopeptidase [Saprospiraceae bacterium]|nr:CPBP family intramembrane glutamic endopeptidase [Saprospiraceae bacterium]
MLPFTLADHIIFGLLVFALPVFAIWRVRPQAARIPQDSRLKIRIYWANSLVLWAGALVIILLWLFLGRNFAELGFRWPLSDGFPEWMLLTAFFILLYMFDTFMAWSDPKEHEGMSILPANWREFTHFGSVVSVSAAVCEEIVFRGFIVTYILTLYADTSYGTALAIVGSGIVFGLVHAYQGWQALTKIVFLAMLFAAIFVLTRSLLVLILLHFAIDFTGGLLSVMKTRIEERRKSGYRIR